RSQAAWLTLPLLVVVIADRRRNAMSALIGAGVWFVAGIALWLVPLLIASGGPRTYYAAFTTQAGEDWSGVDLLATHFGLRRFVFALSDTLVRPWAGAEWLMLSAAVVGAAVLLWRGRTALGVLLAAFVPYGLFHVFFQETVTTRYALPLVVPIAYLAAHGFFAFKRLHGSTLGLLTSLACMMAVAPTTVRYAQAGSPVSRALAEVRADAARQPGIAVGLHHRFKRSVEADPIAPAVSLAAPPKHEWLSVEQRWLAGDSGPLWFLADPLRTDLALIDPQARRVRGDYQWPFSSSVFLGGVRPDQLRWLVINEPGWFAGEGWHLTPETAGVAQADGKGLDHGPITAWLKRRTGPVALMIGGRHLGKGAGVTARVGVRIDGREIETWLVPPSEQPFLRFVSLPPGTTTGDGRWARLEIQSVAADTGKNTGIVVVDQFDAQAPDVPMLGFGEGWQEAEHNPSAGLSWRWASGKALLHVSTVERDLELQIVGESPMRYFVRPSRVVVTAGTQQILSLGVADDFAWTARVPAGALKASNGLITLDTDQVFRPADRGQSADKRALGLRIYVVTVRPVS
ncbi:MAG: hypothetical protein NTY02_03965, partial [Acidobacteria bacterium]|nr:hypothetical protein [Acidobacteriota bacterium]